MIVIKGKWTCFHCGAEYPNRVLICEACSSTKKHSSNMRRTLGMDAKPTIVKRGESYSKEEKERYSYVKLKLEKFIAKFFRFSLKLHTFKDRGGNILRAEDRLYHGFNDEGFHYTIRRDKIEHYKK